MHINARPTLHRLMLVALPFILLLTACGSGADATPTLSLESIATSAYMTFSAEMATKIALTPPTNTSLPSPFPTLPPPSPLATLAFASSTPLVGGISACDNSTYAGDVTIPDGTILKAGDKFVKIWRLLNNGSCNWSTDYKLVFESGDAMGGSTTSLLLVVPVGNQTEVSVALTAPSKDGQYKGFWRLQNASNLAFGSRVYVQILVGGGTPVGKGEGSTITISGNAGVDGATIDCRGDGKKPSYTATSNGLGKYECIVPLHWEGTIVPSKGTQWVFSPSSIPVHDAAGDLTNQDFTAHK